jgi:hypothetical protein
MALKLFVERELGLIQIKPITVGVNCEVITFMPDRRVGDRRKSNASASDKLPRNESREQDESASSRTGKGGQESPSFYRPTTRAIPRP